MTRSWLIGASAVALLSLGTSCYTIQNTCLSQTSCAHGCCPTTPPPADPLQDLAEVKPGETPYAHYMALSTDGTCPDVPAGPDAWFGRALFHSARAGGTYCAYTWHSDSGAAPGRFAGAGNLRDPEPDEPALGMQVVGPGPAPSPEEIEAWFVPLHQLMNTRLGLVLPSGVAGQSGRVRVAVIDSASGDFDGDYQDPTGHGRAVGRVIKTVACAGRSACRVDVKNYAALSLRTSDTNMMQSSASGAGAYGTRGELAVQIDKAVDDFLNDRTRPRGPQKLVINLSLGWSGCADAVNGPNLDSQAVQDAIQRAACHGVLVVAAGGNRESVDGCPNDPKRIGAHVFPAMWATNTARPSPAACRKELSIEVADDTKLGPFVLGISAVDELDRQLGIAAQESTLVAYGNAIVVPDNDSWTEQLSGTSMSAAAVSGMAAAVYAAYPSRSAADVEQDLIQGAVPLRARPRDQPTFICNRLATPLTPPECEYVRRASLCRSLAHAAGKSLDLCKGPAANLETAVAFGRMSMPDVVAAKAIDCGTCDPAVSSCQACQSAPAGTIDPTEEPWQVVGPQPDGKACGTCNINKTKDRFEATFKDGWWQYMSRVKIEFYPSGAKYVLSDAKLTSPSLRVAISNTAQNSDSALLRYSWQLKSTSPRVDYTESLSFTADGLLEL